MLSIFKLPSFTNEEDSRKAEVLLFLLIAQIIIELFVLINVIFIYTNKLASAMLLLVQAVNLVFCLGLLKKGRLKISGALYIVVNWLLILLVIYTSGGIQSSIIFYLFSLTISTSIIFDLKWSIYFSIVNSILLLLVAIMEVKGYFFPQYFPEPPLSRWVNFILYISLTILPVYIILKSLKRSIQETKDSNIHRNRAELELEQSQQRFQNIAENVPGMVFSIKISEQGLPEILYSSQSSQMKEKFKILPSSSDYKSLGSNLHPEDRDAFIQAISKAAAQGNTLAFSGRWLDGKGDIRWGQLSASVEKKGKELLLNGVLLDITEQKKMEENLLQSRKMESLGRLAGGIAHDFNNIMVPISGYIELAMNELSPDSELYNYLNISLEAVGKASRLTDQILSFSRKKYMNWVSLDINQTINSFKPLFLKFIDQKIRVDFILDPTVFPIRADKQQLEQIIMNLVINARDAMADGGVLIIQTGSALLKEQDIQEDETLLPGKYTMLSVKDSGCGMNETTMKQIFEPFYTTKKQGLGTGLGMSIVLGIVQQHKGTIRIDSSPDRGTTFKVYFPVYNGSN